MEESIGFPPVERGTLELVMVWTGREVRALRLARQFSVREFAEHIGVTDRMVSKWERPPGRIRPRPVNQRALSMSLARADGFTRARFHRLLGEPTK